MCAYPSILIEGGFSHAKAINESKKYYLRRRSNGHLCYYDPDCYYFIILRKVDLNELSNVYRS